MQGTNIIFQLEKVGWGGSFKKKKTQNYLHNLVEAFAGLQTKDLEVELVRKVGFRE